MFRFKKFRFILAILLFAFPLACLSLKPTMDNIAGEWIEYSGSSNEAKLLASICFSEDGKFIGHNISENYLSLDTTDVDRRIDITGKWEIDPSNDPSARNRIHLEIAPNPQSIHSEGYGTSLFYDGSVSGPYIYAWGADENDRLIFKKTELQKGCSEDW